MPPGSFYCFVDQEKIRVAIAKVIWVVLWLDLRNRTSEVGFELARIVKFGDKFLQ